MANTAYIPSSFTTTREVWSTSLNQGLTVRMQAPNGEHLIPGQIVRTNSNGEVEPLAYGNIENQPIGRVVSMVNENGVVTVTLTDVPRYYPNRFSGSHFPGISDVQHTIGFDSAFTSLEGYEKIIGHKFTCDDCISKNIMKDWMDYKEVDLEKCPLAYKMILKGEGFESRLSKCSDFQLNEDLILKLKINDREVKDPKKFIDHHPRHKLSNDFEIIL